MADAIGRGSPTSGTRLPDDQAFTKVLVMKRVWYWHVGSASMEQVQKGMQICGSSTKAPRWEKYNFWDPCCGIVGKAVMWDALISCGHQFNSQLLQFWPSVPADGKKRRVVQCLRPRSSMRKTWMKSPAVVAISGASQEVEELTLTLILCLILCLAFSVCTGMMDNSVVWALRSFTFFTKWTRILCLGVGRLGKDFLHRTQKPNRNNRSSRRHQN